MIIWIEIKAVNFRKYLWKCDTYNKFHVCWDGGILVTIFRNFVTVKWLNIVVSGSIASKKKGFIHTSPLIRRKKGLGEGKSPRADISSAASHRHRWHSSQLRCGKYLRVFCKSDPTYGWKADRLNSRPQFLFYKKKKRHPFEKMRKKNPKLISK